MKLKLLSSLTSSLSSNPFSKYNSKSSFLLIHGNLEALFSYHSTASESPRDELYSRLMHALGEKESIYTVLNKWVDEGRPLDHAGVYKIIRQFRHYRRYTHALQISEWMDDSKHLNFTLGDAAIRLDLISKVHGSEQAEKYFNCLPDDSRTIQVYGALLNSYANAKLLDKAEVIMQKLRNLGFAKPLAYNVMLNLYCQLGMYEKLRSLVQEMEDKGIVFDRFSYHIRLNAYAAANDIMGMEKLLMKMEADPLVVMEWNAYTVAANGYLKGGVLEKANLMLKKSEHLIRGKITNVAYQVLMTLYAKMRRKDEVYRLWNLCNRSGKLYNTNYISVISSLAELDDIHGAEKILEEWLGKQNKAIFDIRVPNLLVTAYCKKGFVDKAELLISKVIEIGYEPNGSTWSRMAKGYSEQNQMEKAVEMIKRSIATSYPGWKPELSTFACCLEYLKRNGNADRADEIIAMLEERGHFSEGFIDRVTAYARKGNLASEELKDQEMEQEAKT